MKAILISGVPGSGKSTVARLLGRELNCRVLNVTDLVREKELYTSVDKDECGDDIYVVDMKGLENYVNNLEGCWIIEGVVVDFVPHDKVSVVLYLQATIPSLVNRMESKGYCKNKICSNLEAELLGSYYNILRDMYEEKVRCVWNEGSIERVLEKVKRSVNEGYSECKDHEEWEWEYFFKYCFSQ